MNPNTMHHRPVMAELDAVARCLWLLWRVLLFCSLLSSPMPLHVPEGLLRLSQALRSLRRALPSLESQRAETPYPFQPDAGERLRAEYRAKHGHHGQDLVGRLARPQDVRHDGPRGALSEYLTPPAYTPWTT